MSSNSLTIIHILFLFLFSLTDPPGPPYIEGYSPGDTLRRGQSVELICRSRGGNPPAQLIWYKNGSQIRMAYRYDDVSPFALQLVYIFSFSPSLFLCLCLWQNLGPAVGEHLQLHRGGGRQQGAIPLRGKQRHVADTA